MAYYAQGSTPGLYGITNNTGTYGDANVVLLLGNYLYPISSRANITTTANISGNAVIGNSFFYNNGVSLISTLYSNANASGFLPIYSGTIGGTLTTATQPGITSVGTLVNLTVSSNVNLNNFAINNLANPVNATDAASKNYVDSVAQGLSIKAAVNLSTAGALPGYTYNNGAAGVGATITGLSTGLLSVDGVVAPVGGRVLVKDETAGNSPYNGIYTVSTNGAGNYYVLTRSSDMNLPQNFYGAYTYTVAGVSNSGTNWINTNVCNNPITIGTTAITFTQFLSGGTYTGGQGININTTAINAVVDNVTVGINGSNQIYATGNLTSANIGTMTVTNLSVSGNVNMPSTGNTNAGNVSSTGTISSNAVVSNTVTSTGLISTTGNVSANLFIGDGSQLTGLYANANVSAFLPTYLGALSGTTATITGNVTLGNVAGNLLPAGNGVYDLGSATQQWRSMYVAANTIYVGGVPISSSNNTIQINGNSVVTANPTGNSSTTGNIVITGNVTANYLIGDGTYITNLPVANVSGNITIGNILNSNANGVGNIGSDTGYFDTVFAKATSAQYADLAEMYLADQKLEAGTVVEIGGTEEITASAGFGSTRVIGVVSTQPSYLMNSIIRGRYPTAVALTGRVPCRVVGTIRKGDLLISSSIPGVATATQGQHCGSVIGKALQDYDSSGVGTIEIVVGKV